MGIVLGLVCEGPTDIVTIRELSSFLSKTSELDITIREIDPTVDKTTGQYPRFGWTNIRNWCKRYADTPGKVGGEIAKNMGFSLKEIRASVHQLTWRGLVAGGGLDGLLIMMDTDIAGEISDVKPAFKSSGLNRKQFCEKALLHWLQIATCNSPLFFILPTYSLETWFLATYDKVTNPRVFTVTHRDYEKIHNVDEYWGRLGLPVTWNHGKAKCRKDVRLYANMLAPRLCANLEKVKERCQEFFKLLDTLESLAAGA
jgi:hypothetical protein